MIRLPAFFLATAAFGLGATAPLADSEFDTMIQFDSPASAHSQTFRNDVDSLVDPGMEELQRSAGVCNRFTRRTWRCRSGR